jgi:outer membrane protein OmpA-like peptidoglycan-associated protein
LTECRFNFRIPITISKFGTGAVSEKCVVINVVSPAHFTGGRNFALRDLAGFHNRKRTGSLFNRNRAFQIFNTGHNCLLSKTEVQMKRIAFGWVAFGLCLTMITVGCTIDPYTREKKVSNTAIGAGVGAAGGAAVGAMTGDGSRERKKHMLIGAGVGAVAGGSVGAYMDYQEAQLRKRLDRTGVSVSRQGDDIHLNMPGHLTFSTGSYAIKPEFYDVLNSVALVLDEYDRTTVNVAGHTDSVGQQAYNQTLSEQRARSVAGYLGAQGVDGQRFIVRGYGESRPLTSNGTPAGRATNRRVEITISPAM